MTRTTFLVVILVGLAIILISLFVHSTGIQAVHLTTKRTIGLLIGIIVLLIGAWGVARQPA
jgi:hypothetical protein